MSSEATTTPILESPTDQIAIDHSEVWTGTRQAAIEHFAPGTNETLLAWCKKQGYSLKINGTLLYDPPKTLTLDLGTHTGWSRFKGSAFEASGTVHLATEEELETQRREGRERTLDVRFTRAYEFIRQQIREGVVRIVFEDVLFSSTQMQGQLWASLRSAIWAAVQGTAVQVFCVPVATLKVFATSKGNALKEDMAKALKDAEPSKYAIDAKFALTSVAGQRQLDDNEVDAIWLARYAMAVDRGERDFLGVYQRKAQEKAQKRAAKAARRAAAKQKQAAAKQEAKDKQAQLKQAAKDAGKCCGVFRQLVKVGNFHFATCPKCNNASKIKLAKPAPAPEQSKVAPPPEQPPVAPAIAPAVAA